ncbi:hypothetical protein GCM10011504_12890 [Siccirubricoccus deserti]|nr:hypothetical protein GCM10011504_12890 [Siccirubricoccus deserti]
MRAGQIGVAEIGAGEDGGERMPHLLRHAQHALGWAGGAGGTLGHGCGTLQKAKGAAPCGAAPRKNPERGAGQAAATVSTS